MQSDNHPTLWNFFRAFGARWFIFMCGPATVPFTFLAVIAPSISQKLLWAGLAIACAVFSSYWIWRTERLARNAAEEKAATAEEKSVNHATQLAQFPELVQEVKRLKTSLSEREDAKERVSHVRTMLEQQANAGLREVAAYEPLAALAWLSATELMLRESVEYQVAAQFKPLFQHYSDHQLSVASLRAIASNLKVEDLLRK